MNEIYSDLPFDPHPSWLYSRRCIEYISKVSIEHITIMIDLEYFFSTKVNIEIKDQGAVLPSPC